MTFKVCFNNQIHKLTKCPADFVALSTAVKSFFKEQLPNRWIIQYTDADGDNIMVTDQHDYENLVDHAKENAGKAIKIYVIEYPEEENILLKSQNLAESHFIIQKEAERVEESQVIEQKESEKVEPQSERLEESHVIIQKEAEVPAAKDEEDEKIVQKEQENLAQSNDDVEIIENVDEIIEVAPKSADEIIDKVEEKPEEKVEEKDEEIRSEAPLEQQPKVENVEKSGKVVHENVRCDGCQKFPIEGVRYKCTCCPDFDLCEVCEATIEHPHHFIKMKTANNPYCPFKGIFGSNAQWGKCPFAKGKDFVAEATEALNKVMSAEIKEEEKAQEKSEEKVEEKQEQEAANEENKAEKEYFWSKMTNKIFGKKNSGPVAVQENVESKQEAVEEQEKEEQSLNKSQEVKENVEEKQEQAEKPEEKVEEKVQEVEEKQYSEQVTEKALMLHEIFEDSEMGHLLELVEANPEANIEQLADAYLMSL